jgi:hypothetical protein
MTERERLIHAVAFATAREVERVVPFPRKRRALLFFKVFWRLQQALERVSTEERCQPGRNASPKGEANGTRQTGSGF